MKQRGEAVALLVLLCLSGLTSVIHAAGNSTAPAKTSQASSGDSGYDSSGGSSWEQDSSGDQGGHECPDSQPADSVKDVYLAHATFSWRELAALATPRPDFQQFPASPFNSAEGLSAAAQAREHIQTAPLSTGDVKAAITAVTAPELLLPTSIDQQDKGFLGTYDSAAVPPSEALAVGHHPTDEDLVFVLHAVNAQAEIFPAERNGNLEARVTKTKVPLMDMAATTYLDITNLGVSRVSAYFDDDKGRYVLAWSTFAVGTNVARHPPVFVASSLTANPLGPWMIWALNLRPDVAQGVGVCDEQAAEAFHFSNLQISYSKEAVFIAGAPTCVTDPDGFEPLPPIRQSLAALFVFSKEALCEPPSMNDPDRQDPELYAAVYFAHRSWYRSVTEHELAMVEDKYETFNSYITPARPQTKDDLDDQPLFAMKVSHSHLSVATLTQDVPLEKMCSVETAPQIKAVVVGKGADFANDNTTTDGIPLMLQPPKDDGRDSQKLEIFGLGMPNNHSGVVYWASQYKGLLYLVTGEYWGTNTTRLPSVYWAIIKPTQDICHLSREDQGMVASKDGLALVYPVIAGRKAGGAVIAFSFSGNGSMANGLRTAYPGVGMTVVGASSDYGDSSGGGDRTSMEEEGIDVVKQGTGSLDVPGGTNIPLDGVVPWGYSSAADVCGNHMWFAVPIPATVPVTVDGVTDFWYASWISVTEL